MAYVEHEWVNGETITAEKMNNIEEGIAEAAQSGGGGYDAEVSLFNDSNSSNNPVLTRISGNFSTLKEMVGSGTDDENAVPPNILARVNWYGAGIGTTNAVAVYYIENNMIRFSVNVPKLYNNSTAVTIMFDWNSDDTLSWV